MGGGRGRRDESQILILLSVGNLESAILPCSVARRTRLRKFLIAAGPGTVDRYVISSNHLRDAGSNVRMMSSERNPYLQLNGSL